MSTVAQHLQTYKRSHRVTIREMAQAADVDASHLCTWMNGAPISVRNVRKLVDAGLLTREDAVEALLGPVAA